MCIPYLITFKPTGRFYFGTSQSFAEGFNPTSSQFPSQTTILGAIRAKILEQNNCLDIEKRIPVGDYEKLTGSSPMSGLDETVVEFGKIEKLSPVFIVKWKSTAACPEDFLLPVPVDVFFEYDKKKDDDGDTLVRKLLRYELKKKAIPEGSTNFVYTFDKKIKADHAEYLGGIQFWEAYAKKEEKIECHQEYLAKKIFISGSHPGIARETEGERRRVAKEEHFYRKQDYKLQEDFCFGVIVHFTEEEVLEDDHVFMGGERSLFIMKLHKLPLQPSYIISNHPIIKRFCNEKDSGDYKGKEDSKAGGGNYVLVSPFIAGAEVKPDFALINELYAPRSTNNVDDKKTKTDSFRAIPAGSILKTESKISAVNTYPTLSKIGYNFAIKF